MTPTRSRQNRRPGFLEGTAGIAMALLTLSGQIDNSWLRALAICDSRHPRGLTFFRPYRGKVAFLIALMLAALFSDYSPPC